MRIAAFNVQNLFDRPKVFNHDDPKVNCKVIAHAQLNILFDKRKYSKGDKACMLRLLQELDVLGGDEGPYARIRRIRGQLISRPRPPKAPFIRANGRDDWVGWCELITGPLKEPAMLNTARMIHDVDADIMAVIEVESRPVLKQFHELVLEKLEGGKCYRHLMLIDGNDDRGIDVGLMTRKGYPIGEMRSHVDERDSYGKPLFDRDCPEYSVTTPSGNQIVVLPNHFKSKYGGNNYSSKAKRLAQSKAVACYYNRLIKQGFDKVVVLGDLNDTPKSNELRPLLIDTNLQDVSKHNNFTEFEFKASKASNENRGIGTYGLGNDRDKIDYLLLSPALFKLVAKGGIFRKGIWPGSRPKRWDVYPELTEKHHAASDHHLIWADIDI